MAIQKVKFKPLSQEVADAIPCPKPAKSYFPDWLQNMPNQWTDSEGLIRSSGTQCMPFMDTFVTGYTQELACDVEIHVSKKGDGPQYHCDYRWSGDFRPLIGREESQGMPNLFPHFAGYYHTDFQWLTFWEPQTPPGYSALYHHPLNRFDLPFHTFNGIIDTDKWPLHGPIPFLLKEGFSGVIPAGTPIYQITFIKREEWQSSKEEFNEKEHRQISYSVRRFFKNGYKKVIWERKLYR